MKLIELAKLYEGKIVTNDFNLNKVAQLHGVDVLNINELANALKPIVLPGEIMKVFILKEGKEYNQGVAYLDDGTMVVVDSRYFGDQRAADHGGQDDLWQIRRARTERHGEARNASAGPAQEQSATSLSGAAGSPGRHGHAGRGIASARAAGRR